MKGLVFIALCALATFSRANLIVDGSFENPVVDPNAMRNEYAPGTSFGAWNVVSADYDVELLSNEYTAAYGGDFWWQTTHGDQFVYLGSFVSTSVIEQDVTLQANTDYDFSFLAAAFRGDYGTPEGHVKYDILDANDTSVFGGQQEAVTPDHSDFASYGSSFTTVNSGTYRVFFTSVAGSAGNIDDVQLNPVPEPGSLTVIGLGALAVIRRRRK